MDAAHIKDLLALLRFIENPRDRVAGLRLLLLIPGVAPPPHSACSSISTPRLIRCAPGENFPTEPPNRDWNNFITTLTQAQSSCWPAEFTIARGWYVSLLDRIHDRANSRRPTSSSSNRSPAPIPLVSGF